MAQIGRPPDSLTIEAIPQGPMPTARKKWAAVAKFRDVNFERTKKGFDEISIKDFCKWTLIDEKDVHNASSHKDYIDTVMSLAKGQNTLWYREQIDKIQESAQKVRESGEPGAHEKYLKYIMELGNLVGFDKSNLSAMEDVEVKGAKETIDEIMMILKDEAVKQAYENRDGLVAQKLIPALVAGSFKPGAKTKIITSAQLDSKPKGHSEERPDKPLDSVSETGNGAL